MSRKFITSIIAGAIAVTGLTAAQARASDRDIVRFLAGATALVIIGKALIDENDNRNRPRVITRGHRDDHRWKGHGHGHRHHSHQYDRGQARIDAAREQARQQALWRAQRDEARRQARHEELRRERREARHEEFHRERREARRQHRYHDDPAYAYDSGQIHPRPLPDRVRRHEHRRGNR